MISGYSGDHGGSGDNGDSGDGGDDRRVAIITLDAVVISADDRTMTIMTFATIANHRSRDRCTVAIAVMTTTYAIITGCSRSPLTPLIVLTHTYHPIHSP